MSIRSLLFREISKVSTDRKVGWWIFFIVTLLISGGYSYLIISTTASYRPFMVAMVWQPVAMWVYLWADYPRPSEVFTRKYSTWTSIRTVFPVFANSWKGIAEADLKQFRKRN